MCKYTSDQTYCGGYYDIIHVYICVRYYKKYDLHTLKIFIYSINCIILGMLEFRINVIEVVKARLYVCYTTDYDLRVMLNCVIYNETRITNIIISYDFKGIWMT